MRAAVLFLLSYATALGQSYAPGPGMPGSEALHKNNPAFIAWATGIEVTRGPVKISDPSFAAAGSIFASAGLDVYALGFPDGNSVSLGDGGIATLSFATPITDGDGYDFAVFETGTPDYLELAFTEASSDGVNFFRFPSHSQTQSETQTGTFGSPLPEYLNNLAGKYGGVYGTPFDLSSLPEDPMLDKSRITHIRIIDVIGSIDPEYARYDSFGNRVNDSFPTPFNTSGFDLQGVGVINQLTLGAIGLPFKKAVIHPNPVTDYLNINGIGDAWIVVYNIQGEAVIRQFCQSTELLDLSRLAAGLYIVEIKQENERQALKIVKK
ncbi:T9SS type A sorting domain-containing protein [uncultured Flavobacterium sp.]|uniref:T9SS type A sorting domain-containing protein n=1 Tax=uncultured Flavobacterium sp. TaxID=165435 RepID=UPI0025F24291|nr:T9SS type A sorting domain-containing protein [uncultured Flavobacterium sp.]